MYPLFVEILKASSIPQLTIERVIQNLKSPIEFDPNILR